MPKRAAAVREWGQSGEPSKRAPRVLQEGSSAFACAPSAASRGGPCGPAASAPRAKDPASASSSLVVRSASHLVGGQSGLKGAPAEDALTTGSARVSAARGGNPDPRPDRNCRCAHPRPRPNAPSSFRRQTPRRRYTRAVPLRAQRCPDRRLRSWACRRIPQAHLLLALARRCAGRRQQRPLCSGAAAPTSTSSRRQQQQAGS